MFWYDHDLTAWGWVGMTIGMVLFWGLVIGGIVLLVRAVSRNDRTTASARTPDPQRLLAERFARGEIDEPEYRDRLSILSGESRPVARP